MTFKSSDLESGVAHQLQVTQHAYKSSDCKEKFLYDATGVYS